MIMGKDYTLSDRDSTLIILLCDLFLTFIHTKCTTGRHGGCQDTCTRRRRRSISSPPPLFLRMR